VFCFGQLSDVERGVAKRKQLAFSGQLDSTFTEASYTKYLTVPLKPPRRISTLPIAPFRRCADHFRFSPIK
jgi:hypothetical protein